MRRSWIGADDTSEIIFADAGVDAGPVRAVVAGHVEIRPVVVELVPGSGDVGGGGIEGGGLDAGDHRPLGQARWRNLLPGAAVITAEVETAVVRPGPEDSGFVW